MIAVCKLVCCCCCCCCCCYCCCCGCCCCCCCCSKTTRALRHPWFKRGLRHFWDFLTSPTRRVSGSFVMLQLGPEVSACRCFENNQRIVSDSRSMSSSSLAAWRRRQSRERWQRLLIGLELVVFDNAEGLNILWQLYKFSVEYFMRKASHAFQHKWLIRELYELMEKI